MKKLYYRPQKISSWSLVFLAICSIIVVIAIRSAPARWSMLENWMGAALQVPDLQDRMLDASYRAEVAFEAIHRRRIELGHPLLDIHDPADTGMIGPSMSFVTSLPGHLEAKQTSVNPNFAAVAIRLLVDAGVRPGDRIAIGCTGSFPALNIAVYSAAESLGCQATIISSAASSQFGANSPDMMWPDMEKLLNEEGILSFRSSAISRGGFKDRAAGMSDDTRVILEASIERSGLPLMDSRDDQDAIQRRMLTYTQALASNSPTAEDDLYAAYINVGGGDASVGGTLGNDTLGEGVIRPKSRWSPERLLGVTQVGTAKTVDGLPSPNDCMAARFLASGVPVVNMINAVKLAKQYGLPVSSPVVTPVGQGGVYAVADVRRILAVVGICLITLLTLIVVRPPQRLVDAAKKRGWFGDEAKTQPQLMV